MAEHIVTSRQSARWDAGSTSRRRALAGIVGASAGVALGAFGARAAAAAQGSRTLDLDVSCDGRTFKLDNAAAGPLRRGASFIVNGAIFPAGTFARGRTGPDSPGRIGLWVCRGTFQYDLEELAAGAVPHVVTVQQYLFDDGSMLVSEGPEGGTKVTRAVIGGTGRYLGARGQVVQEDVAENETLLVLAPGAQVPAPNIAFAFTLAEA